MRVRGAHPVCEAVDDVLVGVLQQWEVELVQEVALQCMWQSCAATPQTCVLGASACTEAVPKERIVDRHIVAKPMHGLSPAAANEGPLVI